MNSRQWVLLLYPILFSLVAQAQTEIIIRADGDKVAFAEVEITAKAGSQVKVIFDNVATNPSMFHNVVFLNVGPEEPGIVQRVGMAAMRAGAAKEYIPDDDSIVAATPLAAPGKKTEVVFTVPPPGDYVYICTYLGHFMTMKGVLHSIQ